jgi:broad specificity phosphatase PhoE
MTHREFIVVRHSERLDEVAPKVWVESLKHSVSWRDRYSLENDTPITADGVNIAADAAKTVKALLSMRLKDGQNFRELPVRLYSSRLTRCIQTAYQLAQEMHLPIFVSSGLAFTAVAVARKKKTFQFLSIQEIEQLCPGVQIICCDNPNSPFPVSRAGWLQAVRSVVNRTEHVNVIVAHRETIRNIIEERYKLPYCAIGMFRTEHPTGVAATAQAHAQAQDGEEGEGDWGIGTLRPLRILDKDGLMLEDYTAPTGQMDSQCAVDGLEGKTLVFGEDEEDDGTCTAGPPSLLMPQQQQQQRQERQRKSK